jgi:hypothetical protein
VTNKNTLTEGITAMQTTAGLEKLDSDISGGAALY